MEDHELQRGKERITKLLAMTTANGADENSAANAMRLAAGIAAKLGIELESCRPAGQAKPTPKQKKMADAKMKPYEAFCAEAAAVLYGVECYAPNLGKDGFWFTGREDNIELAQDMHLWLVEQVEHLYKLNLPRGLTVKARAEFRASFKDACGKRVWERAENLIYEMKTQDRAAQAATGSNALVVMGHFDMLRREISDWRRERSRTAIANYEQREQQRAEQRTQMLARMAEPDRVAFLKREHDQQVAYEADRERRNRAAERRAERRGGWAEPRQRNMKYGSGTSAGQRAGDSVKLRKELE